MFKILAWPFGKLLWLCYMVLKNYGWALFVFTLLIKLIMLPSSVKQQKSMARMQRLNPKLEQLKKKYANNKDKLNEATMELYNQENVNPMGSCLPMIVTFVLLFAIIEVVYAPLTYISGFDSDKIDAAKTTVSEYYTASYALKNDSDEAYGADGITVAELVEAGVDVKTVLMSYDNVAKLGEERVQEIADTFVANPGMDEYFTDTSKVSDRLITSSSTDRAELLVLSVARDYPDLFDADISNFCDEFDYTFFGLYLGSYPSWNSIYILIPILSLISQLAVTIISQYYNKKNGMNSSGNSGMTMMLYVMPLFSFWIAFSFPAGLGIYWIFQSVLSLAQTVGLNMYFTPERTEKIIEKENKKKKRKPSIYQQALEQQKARLAELNGGAAPKNALEEAEDEIKLSKSERKEIERLKINEARAKHAEMSDDEGYSEEDLEKIRAARKRMAEMFGDDYKDE